MDRHNRCRGGLYLWSNFAMSASFEGFRLRVCIPSQPALQRIENSKATKSIPIPSSNYQTHMSHYQINILVMLHSTLQSCQTLSPRHPLLMNNFPQIFTWENVKTPVLLYYHAVPEPRFSGAGEGELILQHCAR